MSVSILRPVAVKGVKGTVVVTRSKNLRGVLAHSRKVGEKPVATLAPDTAGGAYVGLTWPNGDFGNVYFNSAYVAARWFEKRAAKVTTVLTKE